MPSDLILHQLQDYPSRITACWRQSVWAIIETGRLIAEAKEAMEHGSFLAMVQEQLPFGPRTAQRLMAIAGDIRLQDATLASHLPASWDTIYTISTLDDATLEARITDGTINPEMGRAELSTAIKQQKRNSWEKVYAGLLLAAPTRKYGVIVEDFEWDFITRSDAGKDRAAANHYPTSHEAHTAAEILRRTQERFACAADDCVLWMWAPPPHLAIAIDVMRMRGFDYRSNYTWVKDRIITGYWSRMKHEHLLIGVKGEMRCPAPGTQWDSVIQAASDKHSAKPDAFLEMIEAYYPHIPKLELNRRPPPRPGWACWGNEVGCVEPDDWDGVAMNNLDDSEPALPLPRAEWKEHMRNLGALNFWEQTDP